MKMDKRTWELLTDKIDRFDEMGLPAQDGEYDINGFPLPFLD